MKVKTLIREKSSKSRDPYVLYFDSLYYYCFSRDDKVYLCVAPSLEALEQADEVVIYKNPEGLKNLWAPELHIIDNKCYIYVAGDDGNNANHRMYVLRNGSDNPLDEYCNHGIISDQSNKWAIDGTILRFRDHLYFIWSGCDQGIHSKQELFISRMSSPLELAGEKILLSSPEFDWEKRGGDGVNLAYINEGPAALYLNGRIYIVFSASGCWCKDYCLGLLELVGDDPLAKASWKKYSQPIFSSTGNIIGPGHCSFTTKNNHGHSENYMIFHSFNDINNLDLQNVNARYVRISSVNDQLKFN